MKRAIYFLSVFSIIILLASCKEDDPVDPCFGIICQNGGTCINGDCDCPTGFTGDNCETANPCDGVTCVNGTVHETATTCDCMCDMGYEGAQCDSMSRTKFLAIGADVSEACNIGSFQYTVDIVEGLSPDEIRLKNLGGYSCGTGDYYVNAVVDGNTFTISSVVVCATTFNGTGSLSGNTLTVAYSAQYNGQTDNCTATITLP